MHTRSRFGLKSLSLLAVLLCPGFFAIAQVQANTSVNVDIRVFHDALSPYGNWVNHPTYGQVWYPRNVTQDWRPYTDGYWAYTNDYGWLWVANEPWGWAPFHYGRWAWDNWYGWIWVPGQTWAPAWVFWRSGGGFAAWAPMPPNVVWQPGIGLNISYFNYDRDLHWDSWVAVRDYELPHRHIRGHIIPSNQNRQIINVTNYTQNITLINNTIVNQGVPVKQIEQITRQPVIPVVPKEHHRMDITSTAHDQAQPNIIRLPMAEPTPDEIHKNEELARRLDGKKTEGSRTEMPLADFGQPRTQESRVPGRLTGAPHVTPETQNPAMIVPGGESLPQPALPKTPLVGFSVDSEKQHKRHEAGGHQEIQVPVQSSAQLPSANIPPIIPVQSLTDGVSASVPVTTQQAVSTDAATMPILQNQSLKSAKQLDIQPLQAPAVDQPHIKRQQIENLQHQQEAMRQQELQNQPQMEVQRQQAERARENAQQAQQQEAARQQELQNQQQMEIQRQQAERARENAQQAQQQEAARQQELQNQQQMEVQRQQAERAKKEAEQKSKSEGTNPELPH